MRSRRDDDHLAPEVRWTLGCVVAAAALTGVLILVMIVALALKPPEWLQILLGVALAAGGVLFAWLVATAFGQSAGGRRGR